MQDAICESRRLIEQAHLLQQESQLLMLGLSEQLAIHADLVSRLWEKLHGSETLPVHQRKVTTGASGKILNG